MEEPANFDLLLSDSRVLRLKEVFSKSKSLYLVGGALRDTLLGRNTFDLDFCTALKPSQVQKLLEDAQIRSIETGARHQTITAIACPDTEPVEITTFHGKNMRPDSGLVAGSNIIEDLNYRDFKVNALALDLYTEQLVDPLDGVQDIANKILTAVGNPDERFLEDPLRLMRLVRLSVNLEFAIDNATYESAKNNIALLETVSIERFRDEFSLILTSERAGLGLRILHSLGILSLMLPEIERFVDFEQNDYHKTDLFNHTIEVVEHCGNDLSLRLAALFHDVSKPDTLSVDTNGFRHFYKHEFHGASKTLEILERLKYSNAIAKEVSMLVATHMRPLDAGASGLRRILRDTKPVFHKWRELKEADALACKISSDIILSQLSDFDKRIEEIEHEALKSPYDELALTGHDLIKLGLTPGPKFGEILNALQEIVLEDPSKNKKDTLIELVMTMTNSAS